MTIASDDTYYGEMKATISATELGRELAAIQDRVRRHGSAFLIKQDGEDVATLEPVETSGGATWRTLAQALRDRPVGDVEFAADLEEAQRNQPEMRIPVRPS